MDASDRSLQIELSVDVLRELNHSVPDENFSTVSAQLEVEKSKPNRFRRFAREKRVSFPESAHLHQIGTARYQARRQRDRKDRKCKTSVQVTDGKEAKERIAVLINELVKIVERKVAEFNITDAIPAFITNVDRRWRTSEIAE